MDYVAFLRLELNDHGMMLGRFGRWSGVFLPWQMFESAKRLLDNVGLHEAIFVTLNLL